MQLACELLEGGAQVVALAESASHPWPHHAAAAAGMLLSSPDLTVRGVKYWQLLRKHRVPIYFEHLIASAAGDRRVAQATIAPNSSSGERKEFAVDAVCVGYRLQPSNELARMLGCAQHTTATGIVEITRGPAGTTSIPGVFVIGDGATLGGAHVAIAEGRLAADAMLDSLAVARPARIPQIDACWSGTGNSNATSGRSTQRRSSCLHRRTCSYAAVSASSSRSCNS